MSDIAIFRINYKSDFILTVNGDAGWSVPFCIKFWTGAPSQGYFVGYDGSTYTNCRIGDNPTKLVVLFDDHHLPIGELKMQIAYHTTIEEFPGSVYDEVTNARDVIVDIEGTEHHVMLDVNGETAPEIEFNLPAYANEAQRIANEQERQREFAKMQEENEQAVECAEKVNAELNGTVLTVTDRNGVQHTSDVQGQPGAPGVGVPAGGSTGQVLAKKSDNNYETEWVNQQGGGDSKPKRLFYPNDNTAIDSEIGSFQGSEYFGFRLRSGSLGWKILNSEWSENDQFPCKLSLQAAPDRELIRWDGYSGTDNSKTVFKLKGGFYDGNYIISATAGNGHKLSVADGLGHPILTSTEESVDIFLQNGEKFFEIGRNSSDEYAHFTATTGLKFDRVYNKNEQKGTFYMGLKDRFVLYDNTDAEYKNIKSDTDPEVRLVYNHSTGFKVYNNLSMMGCNLRGYPPRNDERSWEISATGNLKLFTGSLTLGLGDVNIEEGSLVFGTLYEKGFIRYDANSAQFVLESTTMGPDGLVTLPVDIAGYYNSTKIDALLRSKVDINGIAAVAITNSYNDLNDKPTIPVVPTNVSAFDNDAGYITKSVNDLVNYYLKADVYNKTEVANLIAAIQQFHYEIYASTSDVTSPQGNVLYLIGPVGTGSDKYEEYVYDSTKQEPWVKIGDTSIDLSNYYTSQQTDAAITAALNTALADYTTTAALTLLLAGKQDVINDLSDIRSGAAAGATAYQKPQGGIPSTDMSQSVQESLSKANSALQNHQDISGKEDVTTIVAPVNATDATLPITSLACEVGKYYRIDVAVDTLVVTLPAMTNLTTVRTVVIYLTAGTTPAVTILSTAPTGGTAPVVYYQDGYAIEAGKTYEVNCLWNGSAWIVAAVEIVVTNGE